MTPEKPSNIFARATLVVQGSDLSCPGKAGHPVTTGLRIFIKVKRLLDHPLARS